MKGWRRVEVQRNSGVTALQRPPLCFGYLTTESAPKGRRPQVPELRVRVEYSLASYYHAVAHGDVDAPESESRYTLALESESGGPGGGEDRPSGSGRSRKRGAVAQL
jgi:hypothetical protein